MRMNRDPPPRVSRARAFFCFLFLIVDHKLTKSGPAVEKVRKKVDK